MINFFLFLLYFYLLLLSVIGYGFFFNNLCFERLNIQKGRSSIYIGFYGLFFLSFISLFTSLFFPHNYLHNIILHLIGVCLFFYLKVNYKDQYIKYIFVISIIVFSAVLISKTHDDFSYYHLPFTKFLTENKIIFGLGNLAHGYNYISSLFFLNSTFYLPFVEYYSFHFSIIYFLIFFNFFLLKEIFFDKNHEIIKLLYIFSFLFFNLSFTRLAEYGTDKPAQLLISILIIKLFQIVCFDKKNDQIKNILLIIPLVAYCITFKTYFIPYLIFGSLIFILKPSLSDSLKIFKSYSFLFFFISLSVFFFHHFISTGCIISPIPSTCFGDYFNWARNKDDIIGLSIWLEQWSKAGAGPNFRVENLTEYVKYFNWVDNWIEKYFFTKFSDQLGIIFASFILTTLLFKFTKIKNNKISFNYKILIFYSLIFIIFAIWFLNHPTLRYGGYSIVFLTLSLPAALLISKFKNRKSFDKQMKFLIIFVILIFNFKNITRIHSELNRGDHYKFSNFPFYAIKEKNYVEHKFKSGLTIFSAHHCWATPSPCGHVNETTYVVKKAGYFFISKDKF